MSDGPATPVEDLDDHSDTTSGVPAVAREADGAVASSDGAGDPPVAAGVASDETAAEVEAVEVAGKKYVPTAALIAERTKRQHAESKATRADELERYVSESKPYIEFLKANPQLLQPRQPEPVPAPASPVDDPDALEAAKLMDFYTPEGKPDAARGAKWLELQDRRSQRVAQATVQPLAQNSAQERSTVNFQRALQMTDADGHKPNEQVLRSLWQQMTPEQTANPAVAGLLVSQAFGLDRMYGKRAIPAPAKAPIETEASGGRVQPALKMSDLETRIAGERKTSPQQWSELTKNYKPGRPNVLEDD
jgi:hypothetical protein